MAQLSSTRIHGIGCGSSPLGRNTNQRGRLTTPTRPSVDPMPTFATLHRSATISEIHRSNQYHGCCSLPGAAARTSRRTGRSDSTRHSSAAPWWPTSWISDEATPCPTMRSRGTRMIATGLDTPPGNRVRARRIAAPGPRAR